MSSPELSLLCLSASDVRKALPLPEAIALAKETFVRLSQNELVLPSAAPGDTPMGPGLLRVLPATLLDRNRAAVQVLSLCPPDPALKLPRVQGLMVLLDSVSGRPVAILDGAAVAALRCAAASGAATQALARADADSVAVLGAGVQARLQLEAVCAVRPIRHAWAFAPNEDALEDFCWEMSRTVGVPVKAAANARAALRDAQIVCTATSAIQPVFADADLGPGTHLNAVGSTQAEAQELPSAVLKRATVVVDHRASALAQTGDLVIPIRQGEYREADLHADLGEVLSGAKPGRTAPDQVTVFKSVGVAALDVAAAACILEQAEEFGLGTELSL